MRDTQQEALSLYVNTLVSDNVDRQILIKTLKDMIRLFENYPNWNNNVISIGERYVDFQDKLLPIRLLNLYFENKHKVFSVSEIANYVYGTRYNEASHRMRYTLNHNVVKLISRTRKMLSDSFPEYDWFPFHNLRGHYVLARIK